MSLILSLAHIRFGPDQYDMRNVFYENASMPGVPMNLTLRKGDNFIVVNRYSKSALSFDDPYF